MGFASKMATQIDGEFLLTIARAESWEPHLPSMAASPSCMNFFENGGCIPGTNILTERAGK